MTPFGTALFAQLADFGMVRGSTKTACVRGIRQPSFLDAPLDGSFPCDQPPTPATHAGNGRRLSMVGYCSASNTQVVVDTLRLYRWGVVISPANWRKPPSGMRYCIDNGAWTAHQKGTELDVDAFYRMVSIHAAGADFLVAPDIVGAGEKSLDLSLKSLKSLPTESLKLIAVQDGIDPNNPALCEALRSDAIGPVGIFVGGTTEWKLKTMADWGSMAAALGCHLHVGRVNSVKRIALCAEAGAHSIDGTSILYSPKNARRLTAALRQRDLFAPISDVAGL